MDDREQQRTIDVAWAERTPILTEAAARTLLRILRQAHARRSPNAQVELDTPATDRHVA